MVAHTTHGWAVSTHPAELGAAVSSGKASHNGAGWLGLSYTPEQNQGQVSGEQQAHS